MLQRIQTIFLAIIPITLGVMQFLPIWSKIEPGTLHSYTLYAWKLQELYPAENLVNSWVTPYLSLGILAIVISILAVYELLRYDHRPLQLQLGAINSLLLVVLVGAIVYIVTQQMTLLSGETGGYKIGFIMPVIAVVANLLANYFIRKDEKLVRSTNRIR